MKELNPQEFWNSIPTEDSPAWPVVCVDLNGVLDQYKGYNGELQHYPIAEGAAAFLRALRGQFNTVVVFTATLPLDFAIEWVVQSGLDGLVDYITNHKVPAQAYVDDRAVCFRGNFEDTLAELKEFKPWWQS